MTVKQKRLVPGGSWVTGLGWTAGYLLGNGMEIGLWQSWNYRHGMFMSVDGGIGVAVPIGTRKRSGREEEPGLRPARKSMKRPVLVWPNRR